MGRMGLAMRDIPGALARVLGVQVHETILGNLYRPPNVALLGSYSSYLLVLGTEAVRLAL